MHESRHTYEWVMSQRVWVTDIWISDAAIIKWYAWVMSHIWISHESCDTYGSGLSCVWMGHVTHMNCLCHTYMGYVTHTWVMSHIHGLCHTYGCVMSCAWMSHVSHIGESCHIDESVTWHTLKSHVVHTYGWFTSHTCVWHTHVCDINRDTYVMSHMVYVTHMCVTPTCMWHQSWHIRHVTHMDESESRDAYGCVTSHVWMCHTHERMMSHTWMSDVIRDTQMSHVKLVSNSSTATRPLTCMSHVTHVNESCHACHLFWSARLVLCEAPSRQEYWYICVTNS